MFIGFRLNEIDDKDIIRAIDYLLENKVVSDKTKAIKYLLRNGIK